MGVPDGTAVGSPGFQSRAARPLSGLVPQEEKEIEDEVAGLECLIHDRPEVGLKTADPRLFKDFRAFYILISFFVSSSASSQSVLLTERLVIAEVRTRIAAASTYGVVTSRTRSATHRK
jgi:hypothetical protein